MGEARRLFCNSFKRPPSCGVASVENSSQQMQLQGEQTFHSSAAGCGAAFACGGNRNTHLRTHSAENPFRCVAEGCDSAFARRDTLKTHLRSHTGEKPYLCTVDGCGAVFSQSGHLVVHLRSHTGEKPFLCSVEGCRAAFSESGALTTHTRTHTGEKPFLCSVEGCGAAFSQAGNLATHLRTHTREKPFLCTVAGCGAAFAQRDHVSRHSSTHTGEKPFLCTVEGCGAAFSESGSLVKHTRTHTGEKPFLCTAAGCGAAFAQRGNLASHVGVWHTRCQSGACAVYEPDERGRGTYRTGGLRYCFNCVAALWPERVRAAVRREQLVLGELMRQAPALEARAVSWRWDCTVPGGCSLKRPDLLFVFEDRYVQIEVDEHGHSRNECWDEDARLELIAADVQKPGMVLRINPDAAPLLRRRKRPDGEVLWEPVEPTFVASLRRAAVFVTAYLAEEAPQEGVQRFFLDGDVAPRSDRAK